MNTTYHRLSRRALALVTITILPLFLPACSAPQERDPASSPAPPATAPGDAPLSATPAVPPAATPSLADEIRAQGVREAREYERKIGVRLEAVTVATGPTWWPAAVGDPTRAAATQTAATLPDAFNGAVSRAAAIAEARGVNPRTQKIERASWMRLSTGSYRAWVSLGDGTNAADPAPPIDLLDDGAPATVPAKAPPAAATQTPPAIIKPTTAPDPDAPAWFLAAPTDENGRVTVGITGEADTERDAQRIAFKAGRARLTDLTGAEPADVTTVKATTIKLPDGRTRAYTLVSCTGTIRKK